MTDLEISKSLALAIGWAPEQVYHNLTGGYIEIITDEAGFVGRFDHRDWNVAGPVAEKYGLVVDFGNNAVELAEKWGDRDWLYADTPQKAIALAVIQGAKK
jgi:hypothetical protein